MPNRRSLAFRVLAALPLVVAATTAHATVTARICNETDRAVAVSFAWRAGEGAKWTTTGWWWADPNACAEPVPLDTAAEEVWVYARGQDDDVEWPGTRPLCVSAEDGFEIDDAETADCATRRPFRKHAPDRNGALDVTLRDGDSARAGYELTLCNETEDAVSVALAHTPGKGKGLSSDGWHVVEAGECRSFVRRGEYDYAWFYAQTPGRRLVWSGQLPLCTRYHEAFAFEGADSIPCKDGDSERLPFVKTPLAQGRGRYDLDAGSARAFKFGLNVCNSYVEDVYPAIAHLDGIGTNGIVARGFWRLRPGECQLLDSVAASPVYVYAETANRERTWGGRDLQACVLDRAFTLTAVDRHPCDGDGERRAGFAGWSVSEGANVYRIE